MTYKIPVILIFTAVYIYRLMISILTLRSEKNPIPANVSDVYDKETYGKWRDYHEETVRLDIVSDSAAFVTELLLLVFNVSAHFAKLFPENPFTQAFAVILLMSLASVVTLPFSWHSTMVIEQRYGFNKTTPKTFWADRIKEFILSLGLTTGIAYLLLGLHRSLGDRLIIVFAVVMTLFMLLFAFLYPVFSKLFNKFTPLEEGELKTKLGALLTKNGYNVRAINIMDASRRTTKANAYFTGFGRMKTIVLYDTLVDNYTPEEICAVFAHELGHGLHKDNLRNRIFSFLQMLVIGVLAWLTLRTDAVFGSFGFEGVNYGFSLILIMSVEYAFVSPLFDLLTNFFSRKAEYAADRQAVLEGYGAEQISALKKLSKQNYSNLAPSPFVVKMEYSHPTLSQRIEAIEKLQNETRQTR
ncbi:MAG: M48 family metallopeptidase [Lachnospiraceae bacterium]|nr:M48 family metallopeptidase [Lachnospiraceae bacterium]